MAIPQTTENLTTEINGAIMLEVAEIGSDVWYDAGAVNGAKFTENMQISKIESQNVSDRYLTTDQTATIEFEQLEIMNDNVRQILRSTLDNVVNTPATPVSAYNETVKSGSWNFNSPILLEKQNGNLALITPTSITGGVDGVLTIDDDYFVGVNDKGQTIITPVDGSNFTTESQDLVFVYDYTPTASRKVTSGGMSAVPEFQLRLTNTDPDNDGSERVLTWHFYRCQIGKGYELEFKKYNDEDPRVSNPVSINALLDSSRPANDQLYFMSDTNPH